MNLTQALTAFSREIFIKDFTLTDVTCPRPKITRKNIKLLANFTLYSRNTMLKMKEQIDEIFDRGNALNELKKKNQEIIESTNNKAAVIAEKKANYERIKREIEETLLRMESKKGKLNKLDGQCKIMKQNKQKAVERNQHKRADVKKLEVVTEQLSAKVVVDPESFKNRLKELEEECMLKKNKRATTDSTIQSMKPTISNLEHALGIVERQHSKLPEVIGLHKKLL